MVFQKKTLIFAVNAIWGLEMMVTALDMICSTDEFQCDSGQCIPASYRCDVDQDCPDKSDEKKCVDMICSADKFQCDSGQCIPASYRCDARQHCPDKSDEKKCVDMICSTDKFQCDSGQCIPASYRCDARQHCPDNSDEKKCVDMICSTDEFQCDSGQCIPASYRCDTWQYCPDNSDEKKCVDMICSTDEFQCDSGQCIPASYRCDIDQDCPDKSDEKKCVDMICSTDEFQCDSGQCIPASYRCDTWQYCPDNSDEKKCVDMICSTDEFQCDSGQCIPASYRCDVDQDCPDNSDEKKCADHICSTDKFQCDSGQCIHASYRCNVAQHCPDNSDERECADNTCSAGEFRCESGLCLQITDLCDGIPLCPDKSDERDCAFHIGCIGHMISCDSGECIYPFNICDNHQDCPDKSDERECDNYRCKPDRFRCDSGQCIHASFRCDNYAFCPDSSDERGCDTDMSNKVPTMHCDGKMVNEVPIYKVCSRPSCANGGKRTSLGNECICECAEGFGGDSCEIGITMENPYQESTVNNGQEITSQMTGITTEKSYQESTESQDQDSIVIMTGRCKQYLGLTDSNAGVLGLNSSSEDSTYSLSGIGLYHMGWCALSRDPNPFVQVDLLIATIVEGLLVQNRFLFIDGVGKLRKTSYQAGVKTFFVSYGNDIEVLLTYKDDNDTDAKIFSLPDFDATNNILFPRPFVSRYVRIDLVSVWDRPCMRLEIIGCRKSVDYRCRPGSVHRGWSSNAEGLLRASKLIVSDISSSEACAAEVDTRNAVAFQYISETHQCIILVDTLTTLTWIQNQEYMIRICAQVVNSLEERIVSQVEGHTIFASYGYPFTYNQYDRMIWTVATDTNIYPDIYFIHISLNAEDTIHTMGTSNTSMKNSFHLIINSSLNGNQVRQLSPFHSSTIIFVTRLFQNIDVRKGSGFIAVVMSSRYRRYVDAIKYFDDLPGLILSESLLYEPGLSSHRLEEVITFDNVAPCGCILELYPVYLDVVCSLSVLLVERRSNYIWKSTESWCNLNRPLINESRRIMPRANLKITFRPSPVSDRQEGFELKYVYNHNTPQCFIPNSDHNMTKKFCLSLEFNQTKPTWTEANETCRSKHNGRLATMHTEEEFKMAQNLVHYSRAYFHMHTSFSITAYIGFYRNSDGQGKGDSRDFSWLDGRPLVYSAWGDGFPNKLPRWDCAILNGESFDEKAHVENTLCTTRVAEMFICEINSSHVSAGRPEQFNPHVHPGDERNMNLSHVWKCKSGEIVLRIYHCNGISNCFDASDEQECIYTVQGNHQCPDDAFQCLDGTCISASQFCDHITDCKDSSDEFCEYRICGANEIRCNNGQCILKEQLCNAERNCFDGSDETFCRNCSEEGKTTFRCADFTCIHLERVCDGFYDCPDMDDENKCTIEAQSCQDWWKYGKRVMGVYAVKFINSSSPMNVECNFNHINENVLLSTVYNVDYVRASVAALEYDIDGYLKYDYKLIYPSDTPDVFRYSVNVGKICTQSIRLDCTETKQKIADIVGNSAYPECICRKWTAYTTIVSSFMSLTQIEGPCSESGSDSSGEGYQRFIYGGVRQGIKDITKYPWAIIYFLIKSSYKKQRITAGPLVCNETFYPDDARLPCEKGHPVLNKTRCLYDEDRFGSPVGCVDMSHTKDCETFICPDNFMKCPGSYCLALRFLCDSVQQCPNGEDEADCGYRGRDCPGYFRCNQSNSCLPPSQVCDGFKHCPAGDDEIFCNISCPGACICQGTFVDCRDGRINATDIVLLSKESRKIFFSNSTIGNIIVPFILPMAFLVNLSDSGIEEIQPGLFESMKNLRTLDISYNTLRVLHKNTFIGLVNLQELVLGNNIYLTTIERGAFQDLENILEIHIIHLHISYLESNTFEGLNKLKTIDLRFNKISHVENHAFYGLEKLERLLISYNEIKIFDSEIFSGLTSLRYLETDEYELCCLKPSSVDESNCHLSQTYEFYSCEDLVRNVSLRVLLWIIGLLSLVGNLASFIYRKWKLGLQLKMGYGMFVTNLIVADALMGIYLLLMVFADTYYRKTFVSSNTCGQSSAYCRAAGVLSTLSSEASTFFVMLITLDRILVVKFPFGQVKLTPSTCKVASCLAWLIAIALSVLPIGLNMYFIGKFYSRTSIWFVLPLTRDNAPGWEYLFAIFITLNFLLLLLIAIGQVLIFKEMRTKSPMLDRQKHSRDQTLTVARNLLLVVFANFLCWFPIGVIGILALMNYIIPLDVYSWASVVILPINSVLNPILYTLSAVIKREKFVPTSCEQDIISKEDIRRLDELFSYDVLYANDVRKLTCAVTCIENRTLNLNQIDLVTRKITERVDFLHKRMMYYGNLTADNIWIFLDNDDIKGVWLQGKPKRAVNKQMQSTDIKFLDSIRGILLKSGGHIVHEIGEQ